MTSFVISSADVAPIRAIAGRIWRDQQVHFPVFARRAAPEDLDMVSGAWDRCLLAALEEYVTAPSQGVLL